MMLAQTLVLFRFTWDDGHQPWLSGLLERRKGGDNVKQRTRYGPIHIDTEHSASNRKGVGEFSLGAVSIRKTVLPGMAIPMLKIRRPNGRLIFNMEIAIRR